MAQRIVGLDIGTSALRAVEIVTEPGQRPIIEAFGQVGLPPGSVVGGEIRDHSQVTAALRRLWREGGFKQMKVHVGVAGLRAITREMELPPLPPEELADAVRLQADDVVPFPIDQASISSTVIARVTDAEGLPLVRVLVAAAHREVIDGIVTAVTDAGLQPIEIDLDTAALSRTFAIAPDAAETEAIVSVGAGLTMVVVHRAGTLQFVRTIDIGGDTATRAVASSLDLPMVDAEKVKRSLGGHGLSPEDDEAASHAVAAVVTELVSEIHNSIRYYSSLPGREPPQRVLMTGGGIRTAGLIDQLQRGLDIPVHEASPLSYVDASRLSITTAEAAAINPTVAVPIGLALDGAARTHFDLLPKEITRKRAQRQLSRLLLLAGVGVLLILVALTAYKVVSVNSAENNVATLKTLAAHIETTVIPRYDTAVKLANEVTTLQTSLKPLVATEVDWLVALNQFSLYMPANSVIGSLSLTENSTPTQPAASGTAPPTTLGSGATSVTVGNLTEVTQFGLAMAKSPALLVTLSGGITATTKTAIFPVKIQINKAAGSHRVAQFEQTIP